VQLSVRIEALPLAEPFVIARDTTEVADVAWVEVEHDGLRGFGEGATIER
jgi:L-alanine-DL-glutamate epimerase-like enolase superfamily enzyme